MTRVETSRAQRRAECQGPWLSIWSEREPARAPRRLPAWGTFVVGRSERCDFRLEDPLVSRVHLELLVNAGRVRILDIGSTDGTTVNGTTVTESWLNDRDRVRVGDTFLEVTYPAIPGEDETPKRDRRRTRGAPSPATGPVVMAVLLINELHGGDLRRFQRGPLDAELGEHLGVGQRRARRRLDELAEALGLSHHVGSERYQAIADYLVRSSR
jgi:hypothetical protein